MFRKTAKPEFLPEVPDDAVYVGLGPFDVPGGRFVGWRLCEIGDAISPAMKWIWHDTLMGTSSHWHYACPADSLMGTHSPSWANYMAQDGDGSWWWYSVKPHPDDGGWQFDGLGVRQLACRGELCDDWRSSLVSRF